MSGWEINATRQSIQVGGIRLSYLEWHREGPALVLLHGITSSAASFWQLAPALAAHGQRVFALDMPGHGESDLSPNHTIDEIAGLAGGLIMARDLENITLLGHSWGGASALALASGQHPARKRIARVVLLDPALEMSETRGREVLPAYSEGVGQPASANEIWLRQRNPNWAEGDIIWKLDALARCRRAQVEGFFTRSGDWNLAPRLAELTIPILLLLADPQYSVINPALRDEAWAYLHPERGTLQTLSGTTHNMLRGPGYRATSEALTDWLECGKVKEGSSLP